MNVTTCRAIKVRYSIFQLVKTHVNSNRHTVPNQNRVFGEIKDLLLTLTVHQVAEIRSKIDCPINDPDAILQIMFSGRHISVNWTIMGRSCLCFLMNGLNLMKGYR